MDCSSLLTPEFDASFIRCPNTVNLAPYKQSTITIKNKNFNWALSVCQVLFSICHLQWLNSHKSSWKVWLLCPFYRWGDWVSERFGKLPGVTQLRKSFHSVLKWSLLLWLTQKTVALLRCVSWVPSTGTSSKDVTHQWVVGTVSGFAGLSRRGIKMLLCSCLQIDCSRNLPPDFSKQASLPAWHQECGSNCWGWKLWFGLAWDWSWTSGSLNGPKIGQTHDNIDLSAYCLQNFHSLSQLIGGTREWNLC